MRFCCWLMISLFCILMQGCTSTVMSEQMQSGKNSFTEGNYKKAFHQLLPIAAYGRPEAQYAVGYMYYYGYGVPRDSESGLFWMNKSAEQGYKPAIKALELIRRGAPQCETEAGYVGEVRSYKGDENFRRDEVMKSLPPSRPCPENRVSPSSARSYPVTENRVPPAPSPKFYPVTESHVSPPRLYPVTENRVSPVPSPRLSSVTENRVSPSPPRIAQNNNDSYALQLYGAFKLEHVQNLQNELQLQGATRIWHTQNQGKKWFVLTYGSFPSIADARLARDELPAKVSDLEPWVRKLDHLEKV